MVRILGLCSARECRECQADGADLDATDSRNNEALDAETKSCRLDCPPAENYIVGYTIGALQHPIGAILRAHYQPSELLVRSMRREPCCGRRTDPSLPVVFAFAAVGVGQCVPCPGSSMYSCDKRGAATSWCVCAPALPA